MARGHFRTDKKICVCCGKSGPGVKTYSRGPKNIPSYDCEECFDKYASDYEKAHKDELLVSIDGEILKKKRQKADIVGKTAYKNRGFFSGIVGKVRLNESDGSKYVLVYKDGSMNCFNRVNEITIVAD